ncbi:aminotransferase class III-fold pyridoxal phosphate-dependent enzyme [Dongia sedimenti]|uniref:Aminotransferase class III-fold pyridoxal phosphate-dependent enzyme n=1 Tax=Dongia sedimenti TaxID=3064282 RepID=A0ABU0YLZ6_9PROT|nr:aminotransferase class III-fold pyridoxal phosphate-dependent enzyme [Rhodospirillaceae bacterium R-7]
MSATDLAARIDRKSLAALRVREETAFAARTPKSRAWLEAARASMPNGVPVAWMAGLYRHNSIVAAGGEGAFFRDIDGNRYCDFNVCDLAMTMGYGPQPIVAAVSRAVANGAHFLLAVEDTRSVTEELARRVGLPCWQFTLSASAANTEVMRIARFITGRTKILIFDGQYHGHIDESLVTKRGNDTVPIQLGLSARTARDSIIVPFNDLAAAEAALKSHEIALVITEPALTNCLLVEPEPGYLEGLRALSQRYGALLCLDEAHTFQFAYGGLTGSRKLECDFVTLGKGLGTGISFALYGMTRAIADVMEKHLDSDIGLDTGSKGLATGGTTYGSAIAVAAAKAALEQVLTPENYERVGHLGNALADGLETVFKKHGLDWRSFRMGPRAGYCMKPDLPTNAAEASESMDIEMIDTRRVFMANRAVWDAVVSAGPQVSFAHNAGDIARYVTLADAFLGEIVR